MSFLGRARMWLRAAASRSRLDREMREEMSAHLTQATERFKGRGMTEQDARQAALKEFGHRGSMEQTARDARGAQWIGGVREDLRHAMRYFARTPLSSVTIVLTLALGIGFSSASFSVLQGFLYRPAPGVPDDPALVKIRGLTSVQPYTRKLSWEELTSYSGLTNTFSRVVGWATTGVVVDAGDSERGALTSRGVFVTPNYFGTLRTTLVAGRGFDQTRFDQITPAELTAVVSHTFAQELDGADPLAVVGKAVTVNGTPITIIGVTAPRFNGPVQSGEARTIWLPLSAWEPLTGDRRIFNNPDIAMFEALARLQPGVSVGDALSAVRLVASRVRVDAVTPDMPGQVRMSGQSGTAPANIRLSADVVRLRGRMQRAGPYQNELHEGIPIFSTIALLILLVCTTTVNSLLVGAGVTRRYEIGVRLALGASRWRVVRQLLTEIAILALAAGVLGMYTFGALAQLAEVAQDGYNVTPDATTMLFTVLYALVTATLCGLSPALHATRSALAEVLKESAVTTTSRSRLQRSFVVAQIAIAMPLMVSLGAALAFLTQGLRQSPHAALRERLIVLNIDTQSGSNATRPDPVPRIMARLGTMSGIEVVLPRGTGRSLDVSPVDPTAADAFAQTEVDLLYVAPGFFEAVDAPVILGREFVATDSALEVPPLILSDSLAQQLFPSGAIGKRIRTVQGPGERIVEMEVVGVARTGYGAGFLTFPSDAPLAFAPARYSRGSAVLIRTIGPAESLLSLIRETALLEAPGFPVSRLTTMSQFDVNRRAELKKIGGAGLGSGAIALLMAAIGLYAMLNVAVGQRRREIGVRLAIGARRNQVVGLFFKSGLRTALLGVLIGLPFSVIALRWINSELVMPAHYVVGIALVIMSALILVAAFASWLPARRAATVDPSLVLRSE
jgi:macrolide transport system ATP-binding/permease protein